MLHICESTGHKIQGKLFLQIHKIITLLSARINVCSNSPFQAVLFGIRSRPGRPILARGGPRPIAIRLESGLGRPWNLTPAQTEAMTQGGGCRGELIQIVLRVADWFPPPHGVVISGIGSHLEKVAARLQRMLKDQTGACIQAAAWIFGRWIGLMKGLVVVIAVFRTQHPNHSKKAVSRSARQYRETA